MRPDGRAASDAPLPYLLATALAAGVGIAAAVLLLQSGGLFHYWFGLDFYYLVPPLVLSGLLILAGRLMLFPTVRAVGIRFPVLSKQVGMGPNAGRPLLDIVLPAARRLIADLGWLVLLTTVLQFLALLPSVLASELESPDLTSLIPYAPVFDRMALWAVVFVVPLISVRVASEVWPVVRSIAKFPHTQLIALGVAYVSLAGSGVMSTALQFSDSQVLLGIAAAASIYHIASTLRRIDLANVSEKRAWQVRALLVLAEVTWIAVVLRTIAVLPNALATIPSDQYRPDLEFLVPYPDVLNGLLFWSLAVLVPLALFRSAGVFWPKVDRIAGLPARRLMFLGAVYVAFSQNGILTAIFEFDASQVHTFLTLALVASYAASLLRNLSREQESQRLALPIVSAATLLAASTPTLAVWSVLDHMHIISAGLMEYELTRSFGENYLPHFSAIFDLRVVAVWLTFVTALAAALTRASASDALGRHRLLLAAACLSVAAYLCWLFGSGLSELGHGFVLAAVVAAVGMLSLGFAELAGYAATSSNPVIADVASWLSASSTRGAVLGGSIAFYGILLRPALYETLWFAELYEYLGVLMLLVLILLRFRRQVGDGSFDGERRQPGWMDWSHHRQEFETKPDPRSELMSGLQARLVDRGEWQPLWRYLLALLYRSEAPIESMAAACRPLRGSSRLDYRRWSLVTAMHGGRARREIALSDSMALVQVALNGRTRTYDSVDERALIAAASPYVEGDDGPETLAVTLMLADWQLGAELDDAIASWLHLVGPSVLPFRQIIPSRIRRQITDRTRPRRHAVVANAALRIFGSRGTGRAAERTQVSPGTLMAAT